MSHPSAKKRLAEINTTGGAQPNKTEHGGPEATISGTTKFIDDGDTAETTIMHSLSLSSSLLASTLKTPLETIESFVRKPVIVSQGTMTYTDTLSTVAFNSLNIPSDILTVPLYNEKLRGQFYFRGTFVFTLQVNASPFHCGIYYLVHVPTAGADPLGVPGAGWINAHLYSVTQRSQLPHSTIDVGTETSCELRVPFVSAYSAYPNPYNPSTFGDTGIVKIVPLVPVTTGSGGDLTVGFTLWCHIEDLDLNVPAQPHSGKMFKTMPTTAEQKSKGMGPITSAARSFAEGARTLTAVPLLSSVAAPAAWALDIFGKVTSVFGWSKPVNLDVQTTVVSEGMFGLPHYDSSDNSKVLALSQKNIVEVLPGFGGTDIDELAFDSFLTRETVIDYFDWDDTQATGVLLKKIIIGPNSPKTNLVSGHTIINHTPLSLLAQYFTYWRGDFVYTFHIAKTCMHSGRLTFVFSPYQTTNTTDYDATYVGAAYCFRTVMDIRENNKIDIRIPFTSSAPYRPCVGDDAYSGSLQVFIENELVRPQTAAASITVIVSVSACESFEFAVPRYSTFQPVYGLTPVTAPHSGAMFGAKTQSGDIGSSVRLSDNLESSRMCIGERISSLRQMLRVNNLLQRNPSFVALAQKNLLRIMPFSIGWTYWDSSTMTYPYFYGDPFGMITSMFAVSRGGVRWKALHAATVSTQPLGAFLSNASSLTAAMTYPNYSDTTVEGAPVSTADANGMAGSAQHFQNSFTRMGVEVQVPMYSRTFSRANSDLVSIGTIPKSFTTTNPRTILNLIVDTDNPYYIYYRAGADDYNLSQFISIPPVIITEPFA
jgi:hypothetical protein